jgi:predicted component of type VI protein secretion system
VQVREHPAKPGAYLGVFQLRPHFQFDQASTGVRLVTELAQAENR